MVIATSNNRQAAMAQRKKDREKKTQNPGETHKSMQTEDKIEPVPS